VHILKGRRAFVEPLFKPEDIIIYAKSFLGLSDACAGI
jgi:hypothetical protein